MGTRAGIYVRTSSEHQAGKASPDEQERDCRALAERAGLTVAADWETAARTYLEDLRLGVMSLDTEAQTEEERAALFRLRRRAVQSLVERIEIGRDRKMTIVFRLNTVALLGLEVMALGDEATETVGNKWAGIYADRLDSALSSVLIAVE